MIFLIWARHQDQHCNMSQKAVQLVQRETDVDQLADRISPQSQAVHWHRMDCLTMRQQHSLAWRRKILGARKTWQKAPKERPKWKSTLTCFGVSIIPLTNETNKRRLTKRQTSTCACFSVFILFSSCAANFHILLSHLLKLWNLAACKQ